MSNASALPETMSALLLQEPGKMSLGTVPMPVPAPGELLIKVKAATTCGTDLKAFRRGHPQIPMPGPFGHEYSGEVVGTGGMAKFHVGDAVCGVHSAPCQECFWCLRDQENLCDSIMETKVLGSFAEYLLIPRRIANINVFAKPSSLSFEEAALLEPLACVAQGIRELSPRPDDRILIIGPGAIGLMFVAALKHLGVDKVTLAGRNALRLEVGSGFGAETIKLADLEKKGAFDIVVECTGVPEVWEQSIEYVRRGGRVMLFGGCAGGTKVSFDTGRLHYDQITLLSPFHFGTQAVRMAFDWLSSGNLNLKSLLSGTRTLAQADETMRDLQEGRGIKYAFQP